MLTVTAVARPATGCNGYIGTKVAKVLGGDSPKVTMIMRPGDTCTALAPPAPAARRVWAGRAAASERRRRIDVGLRDHGRHAARRRSAPPSLANCTDLDHNGSGLTCDPVADTNNPIIYSIGGQPGRAADGDGRVGVLRATTSR